MMSSNQDNKLLLHECSSFSESLLKKLNRCCVGAQDAIGVRIDMCNHLERHLLGSLLGGGGTGVSCQSP